MIEIQAINETQLMECERALAGAAIWTSQHPAASSSPTMLGAQHAALCAAEQVLRLVRQLQAVQRAVLGDDADEETAIAALGHAGRALSAARDILRTIRLTPDLLTVAGDEDDSE